MSVSKKDQIAYWSSVEFLNEYFTQLQFNEKYSKATGSIEGQWVRNLWTIKIRAIIFKFVKRYIKKCHHLPEGIHTFNVNWDASNAKWLKQALHKEQVVTFPKNIDFLQSKEHN
jgi:hypothetical protein